MYCGGSCVVRRKHSYVLVVRRKLHEDKSTKGFMSDYMEHTRCVQESEHYEELLNRIERHAEDVREVAVFEEQVDRRRA